MAQVTFNIDSARTALIATGKVAPAHSWADGKRSESQSRDPDTGMPLWIIDVVVDDDEASRSATAGVTVPSLDEPQVKKWTPVVITGLRVVVYVDRGGRMGMRWSGEEIVGQSRPHAVASGA